MAPVYRYCRYKRHYSNPVCVARGMRLVQLIFEFSPGIPTGFFARFARMFRVFTELRRMACINDVPCRRRRSILPS